MTPEAAAEAFEKIGATAAQVDRSSSPPQAQLALLAEIGYFTDVSRASPPRRRRLWDRLSAACGATAFLASQHEASCRRLRQAGHPAAQRAERGQEWVGICFAHLRRHDCPVKVEEHGEMLRYDGLGPWFSGLGLMSTLLLAGATAQGRFLLAKLDLSSPGVAVGDPLRLAVMNATSTASLCLHGVQVCRSELVLEQDAASLAVADMHATVMQSARSLGVARACLPYLSPSAQADLEGRLERCHTAMDRWDTEPEQLGAIQLRMRALQLAGQTIAAAFGLVGGKANGIDHPLQRLAREANFYTTAQITEPLRQALAETLQEPLLEGFRNPSRER